MRMLRVNKTLAQSDELARMPRASGVGDVEELEKVTQANESLGPFVRSLVGGTRSAAKFGAIARLAQPPDAIRRQVPSYRRWRVAKVLRRVPARW